MTSHTTLCPSYVISSNRSLRDHLKKVSRSFMLTNASTLVLIVRHMVSSSHGAVAMECCSDYSLGGIHKSKHLFSCVVEIPSESNGSSHARLSYKKQTICCPRTGEKTCLKIEPLLFGNRGFIAGFNSHPSSLPKA